MRRADEPVSLDPPRSGSLGHGHDLLSRLQTLSILASEARALTIAAEAALLTARTEQGLFYVACVGQFKRGKSTLVNALVGEPVLPTGVVPVTSIVTMLRHGMETGARVRLASGEWHSIEIAALAGYVTEEQNPNNEKEVLVAEIFLPHVLLASGLCLVDTPGLGSVFEASTAATRSFIPHIDAALIVLGGDPPITADELALVEEVARDVQHLLFVLNKADRLSDPERREARVFAERLLAERLGRPVGPILEVSAAESLASRQPVKDLSKLQGALTDLAREAGADLVARAQVRGLERLSAAALATLAEQRDALVRPLEESERRIETLRRSVEEAKRAAGDLSYLFTAEQNRLSEAFTEKKQEFLAGIGPVARQELETELARDAGGSGLRGRASALARDIARRRLEAWLPEIEPISERMYREAMRRFIDIANEFFGRLAASDESFAALPGRTLDPENGFRAPRRFYFNDLFELAPSAARVIGLTLRGTRGVAASAGDYLETLLEHNGTRIVNDLDERVLESRRNLEVEITHRLQEGLESALVALERARARRSAGQTAVDQEFARIESLESRVHALLPCRRRSQ